MVDINDLRTAVEKYLGGTEYFLVDVMAGDDGEIDVEIDNREPVDIDFCADLSRKLHDEFGEALDDCDLTVGSAGLTSPFKVRGQYEKNIGNEVETLTVDGRKLHGELLDVGADGFIIAVAEKVRKEGAKKPVVEIVPQHIAFDNVKYTKYILQF